jgi:IS4 transposase
MNITTAELLDALANATPASEEMPPNTYSGPEIRAAMGVGYDRFQMTMKRLLASGEVRIVQVRKSAMDGRLARVRAYQFVAPPKRKK